MKTFALQGDTLDAICVRYYGRTEGVVETVLAANPGLAELGAVLPHGTAVELPDVQTAPVAETVNLWELRMTAEEKSVLSLFMIGVLIVVGKVLAGGEPITPRLFIGRMLLGGFVSMVAGVVLVQFPDLSLPAVCGIGSMLGIAGYQVIEIAIQRRFKGRGKP